MSWAKPWDAMGTNSKRFALVHTHSLLKHRPEGQP